MDTASPVRNEGDIHDRLDGIAAGIEEVRLAVGGGEDRTAALNADEAELVFDTNTRIRDASRRLDDLEAAAQSVLSQVGGIAAIQEDTTRAVGNLAAFVNRVAVGIHGEHSNPGTGILHVVNDLVVVMRVVKTSIERTMLETDQLLRQVLERVRRIEERLDARVGLETAQQVRAPAVALPTGAMYLSQIGGRVSRASGSPAPPSYATFDPSNPMMHM